jgi:Amino acid permease
VVSAGSAQGYLAGEVDLPFPQFLIAIFILILFSCICFLGIRESSTLALAIMTTHLTTIAVLAIVAMVRWGINGNEVLSANWDVAASLPAKEILKQIFYGTSLGFLGITGTTISFKWLISRIRVDPKLC